MAQNTVKQVAKLSGVSVRTLHYYDEIGLLKPTDVGANGYRYYDRPAVLRLQQILFYRQLGMPLEKIRQTLDAPEFDLAEALTAHRSFLNDELGRHKRLIRTIDKTLMDLNGEKPMSDKDRFKGFAPEKQQEYEAYLVERYGEQAREKIAASHRKVGKMSAEEMQRLNEDREALQVQIVARIDAGDTPESMETQKLIAQHYGWVSHFWAPDAEAYAGLGQLYLDHPDFRSMYDDIDPRLVTFLAEAMIVYAENNLE